ncbi:MAG: hypothetical protein K6G55_04025 [Selenomonadaceae bacterium]|nr:hypothetical protein [Selenomonadaceae bacterium]
MLTEKIILNRNLYLGEGKHKVVYAHPEDINLCIKILRNEPDEDFDREMKYRRTLGKRAESMTLLTKYFGEVNTSLGKGYLFERVTDYDGEPSKSLAEVFDSVTTDRKKLTMLENVLMDFKQVYFKEKFFPAGIDLKNYLLQKVTATEMRTRIIDNIGTSAHIPVEYYFDYFTEKRVKRYWRRLTDFIGENYSDLFPPEFMEMLSDIEGNK